MIQKLLDENKKDRDNRKRRLLISFCSSYPNKFVDLFFPDNLERDRRNVRGRGDRHRDRGDHHRGDRYKGGNRTRNAARSEKEEGKPADNGKCQPKPESEIKQNKGNCYFYFNL